MQHMQLAHATSASHCNQGQGAAGICAALSFSSRMWATLSLRCRPPEVSEAGAGRLLLPARRPLRVRAAASPSVRGEESIAAADCEDEI